MEKITLGDLPGDSFGIAHVKWLDTAAYPGWVGIRDAVPIKPLEIESVGWTIHRDSVAIVLAASACDYKVGDLLVIPMKSVISIDVLLPKGDA